MTTENLIKLLKAKQDSAYNLARIFKEQGKRKMTDRYTGEGTAYFEIIAILENPKLAEGIWDIYFPGEVMT
jgi:hypothetical protein